jgi:WhiB family redox-sensing transcriptional regulator
VLDEPLIMPGPNTLEMRAWTGKAACKVECDAGRADPRWWFPDQGESNGPRAEAARVICRSCVVRAECMAWAVKHFESGIWGGVGDRVRRDMRKGERVLRCARCDCEFTSKSRRPDATFCMPCRKERARERKRLWDAKNKHVNPGSKPGQSIDGGHGRISRYMSGCRCNACRAASAEARRRIRAGRVA